MIIDIPFEIGDEITVDGEKVEIKGLHCFIDQEGEVSNIRAYIGTGGARPYVMLMRKTSKKVRGKNGCQFKAKRCKV